MRTVLSVEARDRSARPGVVVCVSRSYARMKHEIPLPTEGVLHGVQWEVKVGKREMVAAS